jgi:hypothetical protein
MGESDRAFNRYFAEQAMESLNKKILTQFTSAYIGIDGLCQPPSQMPN